MERENLMRPAETVDLRGLACPLPVFRMNQALRRLRPGEVLRYITTGAGSERNLGAYLKQSGHRLVASEVEGKARIYWLIRGG